MKRVIIGLLIILSFAAAQQQQKQKEISDDLLIKVLKTGIDFFDKCYVKKRSIYAVDDECIRECIKNLKVDLVLLKKIVSPDEWQVILSLVQGLLSAEINPCRVKLLISSMLEKEDYEKLKKLRWDYLMEKIKNKQKKRGVSHE